MSGRVAGDYCNKLLKTIAFIKNETTIIPIAVYGVLSCRHKCNPGFGSYNFKLQRGSLYAVPGYYYYKEKTPEEVDSVVYYNVNPAAFQFGRDTVRTRLIATMPVISVQQMVKGAVSGLYVPETTGELGSVHQHL